MRNPTVLQRWLDRTSRARAMSTAVRTTAVAALSVMASHAAWAGYNIGTGGGTTWAWLRQIMQDFVDFIDGPFGTAAVVVSIVLAFAAWIFAPKEGIMGPVLRICVAAVAILNIATWLGAFHS